MTLLFDFYNAIVLEDYLVQCTINLCLPLKLYNWYCSYKEIWENNKDQYDAHEMSPGSRW